jgi:hypothetical protein
MTARPHRLWWLAATLIVIVPACTGTDNDSVIGIVTSVEGLLDDVDSFTVLVEGEELTFLPLEGQSYDFPLGHLRDHLRSGEPVEVAWEERNGARYVAALADA